MFKSIKKNMAEEHLMRAELYLKKGNVWKCLDEYKKAKQILPDEIDKNCLTEMLKPEQVDKYDIRFMEAWMDVMMA